MKGLELIAQAKRLAGATKRRPRQVDVNRAVSATYYALFHTMARLCADVVVGPGNAATSAAWQQTYRALAHGFARNACAQASKKLVSKQVLEFARAFVDLQRYRHDADYDPTMIFKRSEVLSMIERSEKAIVDLRTAPRADLRAFVALVLLPERSK